MAMGLMCFLAATRCICVLHVSMGLICFIVAVCLMFVCYTWQWVWCVFIVAMCQVCAEHSSPCHRHHRPWFLRSWSDSCRHHRPGEWWVWQLVHGIGTGIGTGHSFCSQLLKKGERKIVQSSVMMIVTLSLSISVEKPMSVCSLTLFLHKRKLVSF